MLSYRGAYPVDDETLSEDGDEGEDEILSEDDGENWGPARLHVNADRHHISHTPKHKQKGNSEGLEFHSTPEDIALVRSSLPLPPELVTQILDCAEYWTLSQAIRSDLVNYTFANKRYLQSPPIQGGDFAHPLRRLVITTDSKDQGWSSYPETQGTRDGSWTWFDLTLDDGETGDEIVRLEVVRNVHAGKRFETYRAVIEDERILKRARKGDRLSVWARAMYPGWVNYVQSAKIEASCAC